jgi:competence CoiA-like predicted nuclease
MEARLPDGSQRPDILAGKIAVEFQCSTISAALFKERTDKYKARGIIPFWIYGGKPIEKKGRYMKLTPFQRLFLRYRPPLGFYFISYCPDLKGFTIYSRIIPVTPSLCAAERRFVKIDNMAFPPAAAVRGERVFSLSDFFDEKRKWLDRALHFQNTRRHPFFTEVYAAGHNPYLMPEQDGDPQSSCRMAVLYFDGLGETAARRNSTATD